MGQDGIKYLESLAPWKGKGGFGLDKMRLLMNQLGNPQERLRVVHIAGTNGKGSVCAFLASILGASGAKVGLNISPHLEIINERVVIDGAPLDDHALSSYAIEVMAAGESIGVEPSFFEAITAVAFIAFDRQDVDFAVFEAGLGGRLDATNIVSKPIAAAVTNVQHDHEDILGAWPHAIAAEKAAIFKPGSYCFAGAMVPAALEVMRQRANEVGAKLTAYGSDFWVESDSNELKFHNSAGDTFSFRQSLGGEHQERNAALSIAIAMTLGISSSACRFGVEHTFWPGRLERFVYRGKSFLLDCAHNEEGVDSLVTHLKDSSLSGLVLIFSAIQTKNWQRMLQMLIPYCRKILLVEAKAPNAVATGNIADFLSSIEVSHIDCGSDYSNALELACAETTPSVLVAGSMYMLGPIRSMFKLGAYHIWHKAGK